MTLDEKDKCLKLLSLFNLNGTPVNEIITDGQLEIFYQLVFRPSNRVQIIAPTQYGKSLIVALACIVITCIQSKLVALVAPKSDQAKIIMRYYIEHLGDNVLFYSQLEKDTKLERLRMEENKDRIILRNGGGIYTISAQASNSIKGFQSVMGAGGDIVISDESGLVPDNIESVIFRMLAGRINGFYCKIGNPFYRNHFLKSWDDGKYAKVFIDYERGLEEGRYSQQFIEEARKKPFFDILYACKFPDDDMIDEQGYVRLFPDKLIEKCQRVVEPFGERRLGIDVAEGGGDSNSLVLRYVNYAMVVAKFRSDNTMNVVGQVLQAMKEYDVFDHNLFPDAIGVGKGVYDRLTEQNYRPFPVKFSEEANDKQQFSNFKAECYWLLFKWLSEGGCLEPSDDWEQLKWIKYKVDSSGRIMIQPKNDLRKEGFPSPDHVDALANTFARRTVVNRSREEAKKEKELLKQFDFYQTKKHLTGSRYLRGKPR